MANIRALAIIGFLVTFSSTASIAMPPQDVPADLKSCKAITDDKQRLKCFDSLFAEHGPAILRGDRGENRHLLPTS
jgi:hypothetical protein